MGNLLGEARFDADRLPRFGTGSLDAGSALSRGPAPMLRQLRL
jgi:hypothetical protein